VKRKAAKGNREGREAKSGRRKIPGEERSEGSHAHKKAIKIIKKGTNNANLYCYFKKILYLYFFHDSFGRKIDLTRRTGIRVAKKSLSDLHQQFCKGGRK
jgi:hypothetical protein